MSEKCKTTLYVGNIPFNGDEVKQALTKVCQDTAKKDPTFHYCIRKSFIRNFQYVLTIYDADSNHLWKRLTWFKNRAYDQNRNLLLKNQDTPMWVKAKPPTHNSEEET